jgi:uncharacterized RDD family membrane protein YckC/cytoskeletal protein CcmA (bactofilin family)
MKKFPHLLLTGALLTLGLIINPAIRAQAEPPKSEAPVPAEAPPAPLAPTAPTVAEPPAAPALPVENLRRLDEPAAQPIPAESIEATAEPAASAVEAAEAAAAPAAEASAAVTPGPEEGAVAVKVAQKQRRRSGGTNELPFGNHTVAAGRTVSEAVSIMGSTTVNGEVEGEAVSIFGNTRINGSTGGEAVAVLGNVYVDGTVGGEVVAVLGNVKLGPQAVVKGDVVVVGGKLTRDAAAIVKGEVQEISFLGDGEKFASIKLWIRKCLLLGRPLAFDANLGWAWMIAIGSFTFYVLLALLFPRAFEKCAGTLEERPGSSLLAVLLTVLITPVLIVLLVITGIGLLLIPFVAAGLFFAGIFGKAVMHAWLGRRITRYFGPGAMSHIAVATLIGSGLVLLLYTVPFLGFFTYKVLDVIGLGVVVYTIILSSRREKPAVVAAVTVPGVIPPLMPLAATAGVSSGTSVPVDMPVTDAPMAPSSTPPPMTAGASLPRAGFWIRIAASLIDVVLVGMLCGLLSSIWHHLGSVFPLWFAVYSVALWALKGTTIGGIVCGLKLVRLDDRKVDWTVAVVRGLGGFLSLAVAGLGFIWVALDDQRQSWHDKIAGTTIVLVPKGMSLL